MSSNNVKRFQNGEYKPPVCKDFLRGRCTYENCRFPHVGGNQKPMHLRDNKSAHIIVGEWPCERCGANNLAHRNVCFKCDLPRHDPRDRPPRRCSPPPPERFPRKAVQGYFRLPHGLPQRGALCDAFLANRCDRPECRYSHDSEKAMVWMKEVLKRGLSHILEEVENPRESIYRRRMDTGEGEWRGRDADRGMDRRMDRSDQYWGDRNYDRRMERNIGGDWQGGWEVEGDMRYDRDPRYEREFNQRYERAPAYREYRLQREPDSNDPRYDRGFQNNSRRNESSFNRREPQGDPDPRKQGKPKRGDWQCTMVECGVWNFARRNTCFRCLSNKGNAVPYGGISAEDHDRDLKNGWKGNSKKRPDSQHRSGSPDSGPRPRSPESEDGHRERSRSRSRSRGRGDDDGDKVVVWASDVPKSDEGQTGEEPTGEEPTGDDDGGKVVVGASDVPEGEEGQNREESTGLASPVAASPSGPANLTPASPSGPAKPTPASPSGPANPTPASPSGPASPAPASPSGPASGSEAVETPMDS